MKSKTDDTDNKLIGIGKGRIWKDGDNISERTNGFRFAAPSNTKEGRNMSSTK